MQEEEIERKVLSADGETYTLILSRRNLSSVYPGMVLYTLRLLFGERLLALFRTNSYEYSPAAQLDAEMVARKKAEEWEHFLKNNHLDFFSSHLEEVRDQPSDSGPDVLILQGSPRADGNSSFMAAWAFDVAESSGLTAEVIFVHDLMIQPCIGCYQCYNTSTCTFHDDMTGVIASLRHARLLIICTPVYTSTVPAGLKLVIDRFQAYHAEMILSGGRLVKRGLLFSVAGRTGKDNFTCVTRVVNDFMRNLQIIPSGELLVDGADQLQDIRKIQGIEKKVRELVKATFSGHDRVKVDSAPLRREQ